MQQNTKSGTRHNQVKCIISLVLAFMINSFIYAGVPSIEWQKSLGGSNGENASAIVQTSDGSYVVAGTTSSNDGDVSGNHGSADYWVIKLDSTGNLLWNKCYGGRMQDTLTSMAKTNDNGFILAGNSSSFSGDVVRTINEGIWAVKVNSTGEIQWKKSYGSNISDKAGVIQQTADGGYVIAGQTYKSGSSDEVLILRLTLTGETQWQKTYGGTSYDYVKAVKQTSDSGFIITGKTRSNDGDVSGNHGGEDAWLVKLNSTGEIQWQKCLGGTNNDSANSVIQTTDGGFIVAGDTRSNDGDVSGYQGSYDAWIVKLNSTGTIEWQKCFGNEYTNYATSIIQDSDGDFIFTGGTSSSVNSNYWIVRINSSGNLLWQKSFGGSAPDKAIDIIKTADNGYAIAGQSYSSDGNVLEHHGGEGDIWIVKLAHGDYAISGNITGDIKDGVTLKLASGEATTSTADGSYSFAGLKPADYTVTPICSGYSMTPDFRNTSITDTNISNIDFSTSLKPKYSIAVTAVGSGSVYPSGNVDIPLGESETFKIDSLANQKIKVFLDGIEKTEELLPPTNISYNGVWYTYTLNNVSANHTFEVRFIPLYSICSESTTGGNIDPKGEFEIEEGESKTFNITTDSGYQLSDVLVDGVSQGTITSYTFTGINAQHNIIAKFEPNIKPQLEWQKCFGGTKNEWFYTMKQTTDKGYVLVGETASNDGDVSGNEGENSWIVKTNSTGEIEWQKCLVGVVDIIQTDDNAYTVLANTSGDNGNIAVWIYKLSSTGNLEWKKCYGSSFYEHGKSFTKTKDNGYIIAGGSCENHSAPSNGLLIKLDSSFSEEWRKIYGGSGHDVILSVIQTNDGGYATAGYSNSNDSHGDYWVTKLSPTGDIAWSNYYGGTDASMGKTIIQGDDGNYAVHGISSGLASSAYGVPSTGDQWVIKLASDGKIIWTKCLGCNARCEGPEGSISTTQDGGYAVACVAKVTDIDSSAALVKLSSEGEIQWHRYFGGSGTDIGKKVIQTADGFVIGARTQSNDGDVSGNHGGEDFWLVKIKVNDRIYSVSGTVSGDIKENVTLTLSGTSSATVKSNSDGSYSLSNLAKGTYKLTPSLAGYTFSPASYDITITDSNATDRNFASKLITYSASGAISGAIKENITLNLSGTSATAVKSDANGNYSFASLKPGTYKVIPSLTGYTFSPASYDITISNSDITGKNFTSMLITYKVSGAVSGDTKEGVALTLSNGKTTTSDVNGAYNFTNLPNGTYTITPSKEGYVFSPSKYDLTIAGSDLTAKNFTSTATYKLTMATASGGSTEPTAGTAVIVNKGTAQTIKATANSGYSFSKWKADPEANASIENVFSAETKVTISGNVTITAVFLADAETATLTTVTSSTEGGTISPAGSTKAKINESVSITAIPASGYYFQGWTYTDNATVTDASSASTTATLSGNATITANFATAPVETVTLTLKSDNSDGGSTTPTDSTTVNKGAAVSIKAIANDGYNFAGWSASPSGSAVIANASSSSTSVILTADATLTASFTLLPVENVTLTLKCVPAEGGTLNPEVGTKEVMTGIAQKITATPAEGYFFIGWQGDSNACISDSNASSTTAQLSGNSTITALFSSKDLSDLTVDEIKINLNSSKQDSDSVKLLATLPEESEFNNTTQDLKVMIGDWSVEVAAGNTWTDKKGTLCFKDQTDSGKIRVDYAPTTGQLLVDVKKTNVVGCINPAEGVDVYLVIGDAYYWNNVDVDEKSRWKGLSFEQTDGFDLTVQKFTASWDSKDGGLKENYTVRAIGSGLTDPFADGYSESVVPTVIIDQTEWEIDAEPQSSNGKYIYKLRDGSVTQYLKLDFTKGNWSFIATDKEPVLPLELSRGGDLTLTIKFTDGTDVKYSVIKISPDIRSTLTFKNQ